VDDPPSGRVVSFTHSGFVSGSNIVLRLPQLARVPSALAMILLASCGHLGIDLEGGAIDIIDGGSHDGTGATSAGGTITSSGGDGANSGGADGAASGGEPAASGGTDSAGGSGGTASAGGSGGTGGSSGGSDGSGGEETCGGTTDVDFGLVGWAAEGGGTTGGQDGTTEVAWSGSQLLQLLASKNPQTPLTIRVVSTITPENTGDDKIDVADVQDVTIVGQGGQGVFDGIGLRVIRAKNIILRNLHIHHVNIGELDSVGLAGPADHIWIDHCEFDAEFQGAAKGTYDGLIDAKGGVNHVTYSWNYIHDTWDPMLVGSEETDASDRKLTMHHNRIENVDSGAPSYRGGSAHIFNNVYTDVATIAINTRINACLRIENNVFENAKNPWASAFSATLGAVDVECNDLDDDSVFVFSSPDISMAETCEATIPYDYADFLTETGSVATVVTENAGVNKLDDPEDYWQGRRW
jgi:pectate lyase